MKAATMHFLALLAALVLWTVGLFGTPPPLVMGLLLGATMLGGLGLTSVGLWRLATRRGQCARLRSCTGVLVLSLGLSFVWLLFANAEGPVAVVSNPQAAHMPGAHSPDRVRLLDRASAR